MTSFASHRVRPAAPEDTETLLRMFQELAKFEGASVPPRMNAFILQRDVFSLIPSLRILVAELPSTNGSSRLIGLISWFTNYSSWEGRQGLHICDLWVEEEHRGKGVATTLMREVSSICDGRIDVFVIRSNHQAQRFYRSMGYEEEKQWCLFRRRPASGRLS